MSKDHSMIRRKGKDRRSQPVARYKSIVDRRAESDSVSPREKRLEASLGLDIDAAKIKKSAEGWDIHVTARDGNQDISRIRLTRATK